MIATKLGLYRRMIPRITYCSSEVTTKFENITRAVVFHSIALDRANPEHSCLSALKHESVVFRPYPLRRIRRRLHAIFNEMKSAAAVKT